MSMLKKMKDKVMKAMNISKGKKKKKAKKPFPGSIGMGIKAKKKHRKQLEDMDKQLSK